MVVSFASDYLAVDMIVDLTPNSNYLVGENNSLGLSDYIGNS